MLCIIMCKVSVAFRNLKPTSDSMRRGLWETPLTENIDVEEKEKKKTQKKLTIQLHVQYSATIAEAVVTEV